MTLLIGETYLCDIRFEPCVVYIIIGGTLGKAYCIFDCEGDCF